MAQFLGFGTGADGVGSLSGSLTPIDASCSGSAGSTSLSATNASFSAGQTILIHQSRGTSAGVWELNVIASYTSGTITTLLPLDNTYTDSGASQAQVLVVPNYSALSIGTASVKPWDGNVGGIAAYMCTGSLTVTGAFSGAGFDGEFVGAGGSPGTNIDRTPRLGFGGGEAVESNGDSAYRGEGTSGDRGTKQQSANGTGGGGGQYSGGTGTLGAAGGGGGNGTAGGNGLASGGTGGEGGTTGGSSDLTTMVFGGGGGGGIGASGSEQGSGGSGGGIILLFAQDIVVTGSISVNGGSGGTDSVAQYMDGGSGAGGSILLKAVNASLGSNLVTAEGGASVGGGGAGGRGRIRIEACQMTGSVASHASLQLGGHDFCSSGVLIY